MEKELESVSPEGDKKVYLVVTLFDADYDTLEQGRYVIGAADLPELTTANFTLCSKDNEDYFWHSGEQKNMVELVHVLIHKFDFGDEDIRELLKSDSAFVRAGALGSEYRGTIPFGATVVSVFYQIGGLNMDLQDAFEYRK